MFDSLVSINGKQINLTLPRISTLKKDLNYLRGEADSMALELRLHDSKIHQQFVTGNNTVNKILNVIFIKKDLNFEAQQLILRYHQNND